MFAVIDVETTGLWTGRHDRIVEIAVVRIDDACRPVDEWVTLVNPERDLGPTSIHGITGRHVISAPTFAEVTGDILARLADAVLVGHNVRFDLTFVWAEFARVGYELPPSDGLCTLDLSARLGLSTARSLAACCQHAGVAHSDSHSALGDARATAGLLSVTLEHARRTGQAVAVPASLSAASLPKLVPSGRTHTRDGAETTAPYRSLAVLVSRLPASAAAVDADPAAVLAYADLLDRVLEDRQITADEIDALGQLALTWNLTREAISDIHRSYLTSLVAIALADDVLTEVERADLEVAARLLGLQHLLAKLTEADRPAVRASMSTPNRRSEFAGRSGCFTGESVCFVGGQRLDRTTQELLAARAGLVVAPRVTKKLDLLVLADPKSLSGKAGKAADYGVRRIAERAFWPTVGVVID